MHVCEMIWFLSLGGMGLVRVNGENEVENA